MKATRLNVKSILILGLFLSISFVTYAQSWVEYGADSISYEKGFKIPGENIGNRHVLSMEEFNKFDKLEPNNVNYDYKVKSYSVMAFGLDKGFIVKKCTGNVIDNGLKRLMKDEPFLGYRIIFYDIVYDKIDKQKAEESKKDLKSVFIIEIK
jgi:hypothetical protein